MASPSAGYVLHIANKNYSSWSLRPWLLLQKFEIPFEEKLWPFGTGDFATLSPTGRVPCLEVEDQVLWESLGIVEFLAERHPEVWPDDPYARSWARCATTPRWRGEKALLVSALDALTGKLGDIYFTPSHQQHDEDYSIDDAEWARLEQRGEDAIAEIYPALVVAKTAMTTFLEAKQQELAAIDTQLRKLDRGLLSAG